MQRVASESVKLGMDEVDLGLSRRRHAKNEPPPDPNQPQVALVVLDPHTGELRALVGGRDYAVSQFNHALAKRQPGSSFKPFVYAAALNSAVTGAEPLVTPATILMDEPTTFEFDGKVYELAQLQGGISWTGHVAGEGFELFAELRHREPRPDGRLRQGT